MNGVTATLMHRAWRKVDIKLSIEGELHVLRWRRSTFVDEVFFDDRRVATAKGLFNRETIYGLRIGVENGNRLQLVFMIDGQPDWSDWSGDMRPRGVRLETEGEALIAIGSLGPDRMQPFRELYDRAVKAIGLS
ncbi:hypothetical protein [Hyphococcus sp.]|uniref:hypothetical protein n=1 Tax=Hyphococcus sp. TaxID=2038636 RepID=UPI003CCC154A